MARQHLSTPAQENSTYIIVVALKDEGNDPQIPATMKWTLSGTDGVVITTTTLTPSEGSIGEAALTIILTGSHLAITGNEDEAIRKVEKATEEIITDCCSKLMDLNHFESGCDFFFCTDSWPSEESDFQEGEVYPPLLPEPEEVT